MARPCITYVAGSNKKCDVFPYIQTEVTIPIRIAIVGLRVGLLNPFSYYFRVAQLNFLFTVIDLCSYIDGVQIKCKTDTNVKNDDMTLVN